MTVSPAPRLRVAVLGPVLVEDARGVLVEPPGTMAKSLVVALTLARGALSVRAIVDDLWADAMPRNEKAALQTLVSRLRAGSADGLIGSVSGGYRLSVAPDESDLGHALVLRDRVRTARAEHEWARVRDAASAALGLWRSDPGTDLGETELAARLADTASELRGELLRSRASAHVELAGTDAALADAALADLGPLLAAQPLDEELHLLRLRALAAAGRRNEAIREFGEFRTLLGDTLGTSPSPDLVEFNARLLRDPEPERLLTAAVHIGLRTAPNALVGRDADVTAIEGLVRTSRLTTILGAGGLGKTRLAQELAGRAAARTPGVYVVELAGVRTGDDVPLVLASTLGIREVAGARLTLSDPGVRVDVRTRILASLRERPCLLVMDNCEHLIDEVAEWIGDVLDSTTQVRVLATSRAPLMIPAESVYQLGPLASSGDDDSPGPAVTLFTERARAARPSVVLPAETVARLCDRLDGLPLAIELAAARVRSMSVEEIERRIGNRFALLRGGDRTAPERHRTLLAVIDWSWNLLGSPERRTLRRLSRFVDGFGADAAARVAADADETHDVADDLDALVNQSLITVAENESTGELRYRMLETVREFGDMALVDAGEDELVQGAMLDWAVDFSSRMSRSDFGREQVATFRRVGVEQENLVAALRRAIELRRGDAIVVIFGCLGYHWSVRGAHGEVFAFAEAVVTALRDYEPEDAQLDSTVASYAVLAGTLFYSTPREWARPLGRLRRLTRRRSSSDPRVAAMADLLLSIGRPAETARVLDRLQRSQDPGTASFGFLIGAQLMENTGDIAASMALSHSGFQAAVAAEDTWSQGMAAQSLAQLHSEAAQPRESLTWAERARPLLASLQASDDLRQLDWLVAINQVAVGETDAARPMLEFLAHADRDEVGFDSTDLRAIGTAGLAELAIVDGNLDEALALYRAAAGVFDRAAATGAPWFLAIGAGAIAVAVRSGRVNEAGTIADVRRLRVRLLVSRRVRLALLDHPITGTGMLGLAIWLLAADRAEATDDERRIGWELLVLSRALSVRQDFPSANWQRAADEAVAVHGTVAFDAASAAIEKLTLDERTDRAFDAVRAIRLGALTRRN